MALIKAIAFDLEGTIIDIERAHHLGHLAAAAEFGVNLSLDEAIKAIPAFIGGPEIEIAREIKRRTNDAAELCTILSRMRDHYRNNMRNLCIAPRPGFLQFLKEVRIAGLKTAVGSLTSRIDGIELMRRAQLIEHFDSTALFFAEDVSASKPAPDVYLLTAQRMGVSPAEQLVFEDSVPGVKSAVSAGSPVVAVPVIARPDYVTALLEAGAQQVVSNWSEVNLLRASTF